IGEAVRILVHHATHGHAEALVTVAAEVLHRGQDPRAMHLQRHDPPLSNRVYSSSLMRTKRTRSPTTSRLGCSAVGSKKRTGERPIRCQPPGNSSGYTAVSSPPIATLPAGTRVRGVGRRGVAMRGSSPARYAKPGAKPSICTR